MLLILKLNEVEPLIDLDKIGPIVICNFIGLIHVSAVEDLTCFNFETMPV